MSQKYTQERANHFLSCLRHFQKFHKCFQLYVGALSSAIEKNWHFKYRMKILIISWRILKVQISLAEIIMLHVITSVSRLLLGKLCNY